MINQTQLMFYLLLDVICVCVCVFTQNCCCPRQSDISTITHSAKYRLIIVIEKKNTTI